MTKKKPKGHNIGGTSKQKRRKENKGQLYWCNMIPIGELQLLACLTCGVVVAGYVFYSIRKKRREKKFKKPAAKLSAKCRRYS